MTCKTTNTFEVDAKGFKVQMEEIGTPRLCAEIISNPLDEDSVKNIKVHITKHGELLHVKVNDVGGITIINKLLNNINVIFKKT